MSRYQNPTQTIKEFWNSLINDEANWATNMKLLRASGLFIGAIVLMRNLGDRMNMSI